MRLFAAILFAAAAVLAPLPAAAEKKPHACANAPPPEISVTLEKRDIRYDLGRSKGEIRSFAQKSYGHDPRAQSMHLLGLAHRELPLEGGIEFSNGFAGFSPKVCVWYKSVRLKLVHDPLVFIATEVPKGGCLYHEILAHEMQHLIVDGQILDKYVPLLDRAVRKSVRDLPPPPPVRIDQQEEVARDLSAILNAEIARVTQAMIAENEARQAVVDSPAEYMLRQMRCMNEDTGAATR